MASSGDRTGSPLVEVETASMNNSRSESPRASPGASVPVFQAPPEDFRDGAAGAQERAGRPSASDAESGEVSLASSEASSERARPLTGSVPTSVVWGAPERPRRWQTQNADSWIWNFTLMAAFFSVSEGTVTTPVSYATALLDEKVGQVGTGTMFFFVVVSSLVVGPIVVQTIGPKWGLVAGMGMDCIYAVLFALAVSLPKGGSQQWIYYMVGSICSGIGSGIIWTAQGTFFAASVALVAQWNSQEERARDERESSQHGVAAMASRGASTRSDGDARHSVSAFRSASIHSIGKLTPSFAGSGIVSYTYASSTNLPKKYQAPEVDEGDYAMVTAQLGGIFAAIYLATDVCMKISASLLQGTFLMWRFAEPVVSTFAMFIMYGILGILIVFCLAFSIMDPEEALKRKMPEKFKEEDEEDDAGLFEKAKCAFKLWSLPEIWLLGFTNFTFGFSAGYVNGYINGSCTGNSSVYGSDSIGGLMALSSLLAAGCSLGFGSLSQYTGKGLVVVFGSIAFFAIPLSTLVVPPDELNDYWGASLILIYLMQGLGRSVYESTNKAIFADFFPGSQSAGAFANCMMQNGLSFFWSFILQSLLPTTVPVAYIIMVLASLTVPGYVTAWSVKRRRRTGQEAEGNSPLVVAQAP